MSRPVSSYTIWNLLACSIKKLIDFLSWLRYLFDTNQPACYNRIVNELTPGTWRVLDPERMVSTSRYSPCFPKEHSLEEVLYVENGNHFFL